MDSRMKEIRRILTGFITYEMEGTVITAAKNVFELQTDGIFSGSDSARIFGLHTVKHQYRIKGDIPAAHAACIKAFYAVGGRVYLYTAPDALASLCRLVWFNPLVVTLEAQEDQLLLCIYTARSLTAAWAVKSLMKRLAKGLPEGLEEMEVTMIPQCIGQEQTSEKKRDKKEKKEKKKKKDRKNREEKKNEEQSSEEQNNEEKKNEEQSSETESAKTENSKVESTKAKNSESSEPNELEPEEEFESEEEFDLEE